jgi:hypothetical protein
LSELLVSPVERFVGHRDEAQFLQGLLGAFAIEGET